MSSVGLHRASGRKKEVRKERMKNIACTSSETQYRNNMSSSRLVSSCIWLSRTELLLQISSFTHYAGLALIPYTGWKILRHRGSNQCRILLYDFDASYLEPCDHEIWTNSEYKYIILTTVTYEGVTWKLHLNLSTEFLASEWIIKSFIEKLVF